MQRKERRTIRPNRMLKYTPSEAAVLRLRGGCRKLYRIAQVQREFNVFLAA